MKQTKHLEPEEKFGKNELLQKLYTKIDTIDWAIAKQDIAPFIPDKQRLDIWSAAFFHDLISHLQIMDDE